ncbi:MAG: T9SS type A sorting domain-containing protein [Saprospiraceae bacterium]|nr:T9SS type A sorting domain-containing protein [Saprospiraceae bacterium]
MQKLQHFCNAILNAGRVSAFRLFAVFLVFYFLLPGLSGQVSGVKYLMKYDTVMQWYDCHIVITAGNSVSPPQRAQFNAQYSFVVDTLIDLKVVKNYNPILNNSFYTGTVPVTWIVSNPFIFEGKKYFGVTPQLMGGAWYDDLHEGDTVKLFSILATPNLCGDRIRLYNNESDHVLTFNYKQNFAIGGNAQDYTGNLVDSFTLNLPTYEEATEFSICIGSELNLEPGFDEYLSVVSSDSLVLAVSEGTIRLINPGFAVLSFTHISTGCKVLDQPVDVEAVPLIEVFDTLMRVNDTTTFLANVPGFWISSDPDVAVISQDGQVLALAAGTTQIDFITINGCLAEGVTLVVEPASSTEDDNDRNEPVVYPNPTAGRVEIRSSGNWSITGVRDLMGKSFNTPIADGGQVLDLSSFPAGLYVLMLTDDHGKVHQTPVIHH